MCTHTKTIGLIYQKLLALHNVLNIKYAHNFVYDFQFGQY